MFDYPSTNSTESLSGWRNPEYWPPGMRSPKDEKTVPDRERLLSFLEFDDAGRSTTRHPTLPALVINGSRPLPVLRRHSRRLSHSCSRTQVVLFILSTTAYWVVTGVVIMLFGMVTLRLAILPRIYTCPGGATCPISFDPRGNILRVIQTIMLYWFQAGSLIAGIGLAKVLAYSSWVGFKRKGSTVRDLDKTLGALKGNGCSAAWLLWNMPTRSTGVFTLAQFAITAIIPLVVNRSMSAASPHAIQTSPFAIQTTDQTVRLSFAYPKVFALPTHVTDFASLDQRKIYNKLEGWIIAASNGSGSISDDFQGTLIVRDNRTIYSPHAMPKGPRIKGNISCSGANITSRTLEMTMAGNAPWYKIGYQGSQVVVDSSLSLSAISLATEQVLRKENVFPVLWASTRPGWIPNATRTFDGQMYLAVCNHSATMDEPLPVIHKDIEYINPSQPISGADRGAAGTDPSSSEDFPPERLGNLVEYLVLKWWTGNPIHAQEGQTALPVSCNTNVLSPFGRFFDAEECDLNNERWTSTLAAMLDAIVQAGDKSGTERQELWATTVSISRRRWLLQAVIPCSTILLYLAAVGYTLSLGIVHDGLRELTLSEVISAAACTEDILDLARHGRPVGEGKIGGTGHWATPQLSAV